MFLIIDVIPWAFLIDLFQILYMRPEIGGLPGAVPG